MPTIDLVGCEETPGGSVPLVRELPPPYEEAVKPPIPIVANIWRYSFVSPKSSTPTTRFGTGKRYVGRRISTIQVPVLLSATTPHDDLFLTLANTSAQLFGWTNSQIAYSFLLMADDGTHMIVPKSWDGIRAAIADSPEGVLKGRARLVLAAGPVKEIGWIRKLGCMVLDLGRKSVGTGVA